MWDNKRLVNANNTNNDNKKSIALAVLLIYSLTLVQVAGALWVLRALFLGKGRNSLTDQSLYCDPPFLFYWKGCCWSCCALSKKQRDILDRSLVYKDKCIQTFICRLQSSAHLSCFSSHSERKPKHPWGNHMGKNVHNTLILTNWMKWAQCEEIFCEHLHENTDRQIKRHG